ncbi:Protein of unknown function [Flavobacterium swingsii]|jgi:uncharacterized protein (DUF983 family)|uniref:DUF983 domain-containing protein n=2 Tax=Flavobacterium swingsii TaxID=498292 RepID=A0A1I0VKG7_9FLAO|nr:Protein of unknown function [Flavobacterium swingsii]
MKIVNLHYQNHGKLNFLQMLKKGSKLYSILTGTCPKCHEESMYKVKNSYILSKVFDMHEKCSHCGLKYKMEPSFFFGAMFVSYALGVGLGIITFLVSHYGFQTNLKTSFVAIMLSLTCFMPIIMRLSRNIWINLNIGFDKDWKEKLK